MEKLVPGAVLNGFHLEILLTFDSDYSDYKILGF